MEEASHKSIFKLKSMQILRFTSNMSFSSKEWNSTFNLVKDKAKNNDRHLESALFLWVRFLKEVI